MHPNFYCSPVNVFVLWLSGYGGKFLFTPKGVGKFVILPPVQIVFTCSYPIQIFIFAIYIPIILHLPSTHEILGFTGEYKAFMLEE